MGISEYIKTKGCTITVILAVTVFMASLLINTAASDTDRIAEKTSQRLEKRMKVLDRYMEKAMDSDHNIWLDIQDLPEDMVIYRYVYDTLQSWCNQFPVINDDIGSRLIFHRLTNLRGSLTSPLAEIGGDPSYVNLGTQWYVVKSISDGVSCKVIGGIEIKNDIITDIRTAGKPTNPVLRLPSNVLIMPINYSGGSAVTIDSAPIFKVIADINPDATPFMADSMLRWLALLFFTLSVVLYLWTHRTVRSYVTSIIILLCITVTAYVWGRQLQETSVLFSPTIYADGHIMYSFGALIIISAAVFLGILCTYIVNDCLVGKIMRSGKKTYKTVYTIFHLLLLAATLLYIHFSLKSVITNSVISMELYAWNSISGYTFWVYLIYTVLMIGILLQIQMFRPVIKDMAGIKFNAFSKKFLFTFATACSLYFTVTSGILGFQKEQDRVSVWANRLAIDRNLGLELQLRSIEDGIANDQLFPKLVKEDDGSPIILNRLKETYMSRLAQDYDISVSVCKDPRSRQGRPGDPGDCLAYFNEKIRYGTPISADSRFIYTYIGGRSSYTGMFIFYSPEDGVIRMFIEVEQKNEMEESGYYSILENENKPGNVHIPAYYSYAKFISGKPVSYKGNYAYPTIIDTSLIQTISEKGHYYFNAKGYIHFCNQISDDEIIIISRPVRGITSYLVTFSYLILISYSALFLLSSERRKKKSIFRKNYFRSRINTVLFCALLFTLIIMAAVSIMFVYKRNEQNMYNIMSSKISTIQVLLESRCRYIDSYREMGTQEFSSLIDNVASTTKTDVTLYTPGGKVFKSTTPEIFDRMIIGTRINQEAYYNIKYKNQRFYIHKERIAGHKYYAQYAPIVNDKGVMIAIVCSPYTDLNYDFTRDALFHAATIINLFFILLMATILASSAIVNAMFKPLIEMGRKMSTADLHGLEYIIYKREDEISVLVDAYNRMVHDLSDSSRKLAQAERDKAWSEMARQVAHEIKNPLTPIKLEIQRLIRLKQRNDPSWSEKFDKVAAVVLEHIDILTDTANEFSTFAKLYSEDPVLIDLDKTLRDQLVIFDNRDNIEFSYIGMENAMVMAPKPQLIRVFVNLITNAVQAIEIQQKEYLEDGKEVKPGHILICLRNSIKDGYYDIVFEDDGPGVKDENLLKLFTPNFTTKSSGTGLGLAICRNIIEKCNGDIQYQKSFRLNGACFTVRLPKYGQPRPM